MRFAFDEKKSDSNKKKHGIDFREAQAIWRDNNRFVFPSAYTAEAREVTVGAVAGKCWAAVTVTRGDTVRIISVRSARRKENDAYKKSKTDFR